MSPSVSLTRSGLPRIVPSFHRRKIRAGDVQIIQLYMSLFSISKLIELAPRVRKSLFASVSSPPESIDSIMVVASEMRPHLRSLILRYVPAIDRIPFLQGMSFVPTWKSVPSSAWYTKLLRRSADEQDEPLKRYALRLLFTCELAAFTFLMNKVHAKGESYSQGCLWAPYVRYAIDSFNREITNLSLEFFEKRIGPYLPHPSQMEIPANTGRLCASCTGDGKRRLFAVGNYINQRLLYPMHQWLASVLKSIPMDV